MAGHLQSRNDRRRSQAGCHHGGYIGLPVRNGQAFHFSAQLFGHRLCPALIRKRKHDDKFFTAVSGNDIAGTLDSRTQRIGYLLQTKVSLLVTIGVVVLFEIVDID